MIREIVSTFGMENLTALKRRALIESPSLADPIEDFLGCTLNLRNAVLIHSINDEDGKEYDTIVMTCVLEDGTPALIKTSSPTYIQTMTDYLKAFEDDKADGVAEASEMLRFRPVARPSKKYAGKEYFSVELV